MKKILGILVLCLALPSCGYVAQGAKGDQGLPGEPGLPGRDGSSVLTGYGDPNYDVGKTGDSYIDLETWNFYIKSSDGWVLKGNIKGKTGDDGQMGRSPQISIGDNGNWFIDGVDTGVIAKGSDGQNGTKGENGQDGVSIADAYIDSKGNLIILLSDDNVINVGKINGNYQHIVNYYFDDTLMCTETVVHGDKITGPVIDNATVYGWYLDKSLTKEWITYGYAVTEDMNLYASFTLDPLNISYNSAIAYTLDDAGYGEIAKEESIICVSKALPSEHFIELDSRGIIFNKDEIGLIDRLEITIDENCFESAQIYCGNSPLSFDYCETLTSGVNTIEFDNVEYFTIQNQGNTSLCIDSLDITYRKKTKCEVIEHIPVISIDTNDVEITSKEEYVNCIVSTSGKGKDANGLSGKIKLRGNTTFNKPKKPYRIKLDKKNGLFGYEKAKNWVLLADYLDASKMHNYSALSFSKLLNGDESFSVSPLHVKLILNGVDMGLYLFCEHIEAKSGRLDIEQETIWQKSFNEINFYVERDESTIGDPAEIEGVTYFNIGLENYTEESYTFSLKYPEKEDFFEEKEDGTVDEHEDEFIAFFNDLQTYFQSVCDAFINCKNSNYSDHYDELSEIVDLNSLVKYALVDQLMVERDHHAKSFKMYRRNGGLLQFGPNWDYDLCVSFLPASSSYVIDPFGAGEVRGETLVMSEQWSLILLKNTEGRNLYKQAWNDISCDAIMDFLDSQFEEICLIASCCIDDCARWMESKVYILFDNQLYFYQFLEFRFQYLKSTI